MKKRVRLILAVVHFIARIQGGVLWIQRKIKGAPAPAPGPERHLVLLAEGPMVHFMAVAIFPDKIIEQYGMMGQPTPREQHPPGIKDNIMDRVAELIEDQDYVPMADFPGTGEVTVTFPQDTEIPGPDIGDFLADRGLGIIAQASPKAMTITSPNPALCGPLLAAELSSPGLDAQVTP